jgi:hypothetical protein
MKKPGIKPGFFTSGSASMTLVTVGQVAANAAAQCTAQACADGGTGTATQAFTDHRTTGCADTATDGSAGAMTFFGGNCAARRASNARTDHCASAAAHFLADHVTQRAAQATTQRGSTVTSHCTLSNQKPQNQSGQC